MRKFLLLAIAILLSVNSFSPSFAEEEKAPAMAEPPAKAEVKNEKCTCDESAILALDKAFESVEEDEWIDAIGICNKSISTITKSECKCKEMETYKKIATAYLNYAKGGQILDGEDDIDCDKAKKLYNDALTSLNEVFPILKNEDLKNEVENIRDYCEEEKAFVEDECE